MFRSRRPQVRVSDVPSSVVQWICVVPRNHHDENRTMNNSAGAGPEPPQSVSALFLTTLSQCIWLQCLQTDCSRLWVSSELHNKMCIIDCSVTRVQKRHIFACDARIEEWKIQKCVSKPCVSGISDSAKSSCWGDGTHTRMWAPSSDTMLTVYNSCLFLFYFLCIIHQSITTLFIT